MSTWFTKAPEVHLALAETARQNTIQSRANRSSNVEGCAKYLYTVVCQDVISHSNTEVSSEKEFNITNPDLCKRVAGLSGLTFTERDTVLKCVAQKLLVERFTTYIDGTIIKVSWPVDAPKTD